MLWWTTQNLVTTTLLAGIVWCVCRLMRVGPVWRHALWMVVLAKLLTPPLIFWPWAVHNPLRLSERPATVIAKVAPVLSLSPGPILSATTQPAMNVSPETPWPSTSTDAGSDLEPTLDLTGVDETPYAEMAAAPLGSRAVDAIAVSGNVAVEPVVRNRIYQVVAWLGRIWIGGGVAITLLQGVRIIRMITLVRRAKPAGPALLRHVEAAARRLGVRAVAVRMVPGIGSPVIWSLRRPLLLWPEELPAGVSEQAIRGLIVHELAHVKRRDHWVGWLELLAGLVWWWDPLFWYVRHQLRENAELACDAWVVSALAGEKGADGGRDGRRAYAEALLAVCECASNKFNQMNRLALRRGSAQAPMPAVGVSTGGRRFLERRLAMILRDRVSLRLPRLGFLSVALLALGTLPAWSQKVPEGEQPADVGSAAIGRDSWIYADGSTGTVAISPDGATRIYGYAVPALPAAQKVLDRLTREQDEARREARRKIDQAKESAIRELKQLQDTYTKAGQLDEAVAVRDLVRRLSVESTAVRGILMRRKYEATDVGALPDPGNLLSYRDKVGQSFYFDVTGATEGYVWGNVIYTDDSTLSAAAVHAGVLTSGQRGVVKVTMLPGRDSYAGSDSNGVTSESYGPWPGSYMVEAFDPHKSGYPAVDFTGTSGGPAYPGGGPVHLRSVSPGGPPAYPGLAPGMPGGLPAYPRLAPGSPGLPAPGPETPGGDSGPGGGNGLAPAIPGGTGSPVAPGVDSLRGETPPALPVDPASSAGSLQQLRDKVGQSIETALVGSTQGSVWGTDIYTDDSSPAAAAVHAGVLRDGESGRVRITILPGQDSYQGSDHNGISSQSWQSWGGSFRIERADQSPKDSATGTLPK